MSREIYDKFCYWGGNLNEGRLVSVYIGNGSSFKMKGMKAVSEDGKPFDAWLEWKDGKWVCHTENRISLSY